MINRNDPCWCGSGKKWKKCHYPIMPKADWETVRKLYAKNYRIQLKTEEQIRGIREACRLTSEVLDETCALAKEGVTTLE